MEGQGSLRQAIMYRQYPYSEQKQWETKFKVKETDLDFSSQVALLVKNPPANARDTGDSGSIPGLGRYPGVGNCNPLQYSCLGNSMDKGAWLAVVHGVAKSQTQLSN